MRDILDFLAVRDEEVLTANFYARIPETQEDVGIVFNYDIVNENDKTYSTILGNIKSDKGTTTIKTVDNCGFKVNGYISTQDGCFWQITGVGKHIIKPDNKHALRLLKETSTTEYVLRLLEVENPWELK